MAATDTKKTGAVLVQGAGIAGVQAALDLASAGLKVFLVERSPAIGGMMAHLDKTFPTGDCATCIVSPKLVACARELNIEILTLSELKDITGEPGQFTATVIRHPRYVDEDKCIACGACAEKCPSKVPDPFNRGLSKRKAAYVANPQAVPLKYAIDGDHCLYLNRGKCGLCKTVCPAGAIDYDQKPVQLDLEVGAVILAPGFKEFQAERSGEYGFGRYQNVLSNVQFERVLSASGPFDGHVLRRSDNQEAKRIAFIQCVGSRDDRCGNGYCSSVCCMAATKQAMIAAEHVPGLEVTLFYMDIRAFGKDFDPFYERARKTPGIRYVKAIPSRIMELPGSKDLRLRYRDTKEGMMEIDVDMVVLSLGLDPKPAVSESMAGLGIELNDYGFCRTDRLSPLETSRPGVFVSGVFQEPKDIPETVTQASAAAAMSMEMLGSARHTLMMQQTFPEEHDVTDEEPRIGVFVCHCGSNIAGVVDVARVSESVAGDADVVLSTHTVYACADASLSDLKEAIRKNRLNRVVVASCTPRTHEMLFRQTLREAGLNPYLFELANIRDQCSWVHGQAPEAATEKAIDLVRMSIARARLLKPLTGEKLPMNPDGLVIGGGLAGMTASLSLADQGFLVHLVEKTDLLGGHLNTLTRTLEHDRIDGFRMSLNEKIEAHPGIRVHRDAQVTGISGHVGKFSVSVTSGEASEEISCGAVVVATGAKPASTSEYGYGTLENIMTQKELETALDTGACDGAGRTFVMIQCVGSRTSERPWCSRVCCAMAVKNALVLKTKFPDASIIVLYRDIRTYGFREDFYREARQQGVVFVRYTGDAPPAVTSEDGLLVTVTSPDFPEPLEIETHRVVLSTGIEADPGNRALADLLKVPLNASGFFSEAHPKLRPVDFSNEGIFLCGLAHSPKFTDETISQAKAAAARAATILSRKTLDLDAQVSRVDQTKCISCMTCVHACPYGAPYVNMDHKAQIAAARCMGCGICASECPARAIELNHFERNHFNVMLDELFRLKN